MNPELFSLVPPTFTTFRPVLQQKNNNTPIYVEKQNAKHKKSALSLLNTNSYKDFKDFCLVDEIVTNKGALSVQGGKTLKPRCPSPTIKNDHEYINVFAIELEDKRRSRTLPREFSKKENLKPCLTQKNERVKQKEQETGDRLKRRVSFRETDLKINVEKDSSQVVFERADSSSDKNEKIAEMFTERLESQRLENQRLENQRLENQRLESQRLENQRLENQRLENQRLENQRFEIEKTQNESNCDLEDKALLVVADKNISDSSVSGFRTYRKINSGNISGETSIKNQVCSLQPKERKVNNCLLRFALIANIFVVFVILLTIGVLLFLFRREILNAIINNK